MHEIAENYDFENKYINYKSYKRGKNTPPLMVLSRYFVLEILQILGKKVTY